MTVQRIDFDYINDVVTEVANGIMGYKNTKEKVQRLLLKTICNACKEYDSNPDFKRQIDNVANIL